MGKLKKVKAPEGASLTFVWADPTTLDEHPENWKTHPDFQSQVVGDLIERHGWIKPLVYSNVSNRLLDGHDRRKIAIASGMKAVPVIIGDWPAESEPEILATLDPSGALSKGDPEALDRLLKQMSSTTDAVGTLVNRLAESEGVLEWLRKNPPQAPPPTFTGPETPEPETRTVTFQAGNGTTVKRVQLFFDAEQLAEFRELVDALAADFGTANDSDTVLAALRDTYEAAQPASA